MMPFEGADDDAAALWAMRLDAQALDMKGQSELETWLSQEPRRAGALLRAQAALNYVDRGQALDAGTVPAKALASERLLSRRAMIAASSGVAAAAAGLFMFFGRSLVVDSGIGELRRVPLADGSLATLNTRTRVEIAMATHQRTVRLDEGEAWFRVAKERQRPFVVETGEIRVRAVGTAFAVRRRENGADVLVTEGVVETWVVGREDRRRRIASGSRGFVPSERAEIEVATAPHDIERALAWRGGELALSGQTLSYAASELNRYNVRQIVIGDPAIGNEQLVGFFRTTEPENFAHAVAGMVGGSVVVEGETIRIERRD